MRQLIHRAMHQPDELVVTFEYRDAKTHGHAANRQPMGWGLLAAVATKLIWSEMT
jgi:hypothetical protein